MPTKLHKRKAMNHVAEDWNNNLLSDLTYPEWILISKIASSDIQVIHETPSSLKTVYKAEWFSKWTPKWQDFRGKPLIEHNDFSRSSCRCQGLQSSLPWVPEVFFLVGSDRIERRSREGESRSDEKKPLAPTDNNLTSMPTPVSFDWHPQSELILETQQAGFSHA